MPNAKPTVFFHDRFVWPFIFWLPKFILPNHLTAFRFIATPFVLFLLWQEAYNVGIPSFIFVALTDIFDGTLARKRGLITKWGIRNDPIADKLLVGSVLLLVAFQYISLWLIGALLIMESSIIIGGLLRARYEEPAANWWGKYKMLFEFFGLTLLLYVAATGNVALILPVSILFLIAIVLGIISLFTYSL